MTTRFGYCCINTTLQKQGITCNRTARKATFESKGMQYIARLVLGHPGGQGCPEQAATAQHVPSVFHDGINGGADRLAGAVLIPHKRVHIHAEGEFTPPGFKRHGLHAPAPFVQDTAPVILIVSVMAMGAPTSLASMATVTKPRKVNTSPAVWPASAGMVTR